MLHNNVLHKSYILDLVQSPQSTTMDKSIREVISDLPKATQLHATRCFFVPPSLPFPCMEYGRNSKGGVLRSLANATTY